MSSGKAFSFAVLLAAFATLCSGQESCTRQLELTPVSNFSIDAILGGWVNWNTYYPKVEDVDPTPILCLREHIAVINHPFEPYDMGIIHTYNTSTGEYKRNDTYLDKPSVSSPSQAIWVRFTKQPDSTFVRSDSVYVHTDYNNWALQYVCTKYRNRIVENMIVWTRDRQPNPDTIALLEVLVENYGFPLENRRPIDQSDCQFE